MKIFEYSVFGFFTGVLSGLSPGPLLALAVSETLKGHIKNGILVSISPVFSDIPVLLLSLFIIEEYKNARYFFSFVSFLGAVFLFYLGFKHIKAHPKMIDLEEDIHKAFLKGLTINFLSPYTYLFWFFVGAPFLKNSSFFESFSFVLFYFLGITCSMLIVVFFTEKVKNFLESGFYVFILKILGFGFLIFGFILLYDSYKYLICSK